MKNWKYLLLSLLSLGVMTSCLKGDGWEPYEPEKPQVPVLTDDLQIHLSATVIQANGEDYTTITVYKNKKVLKDGYAFYTYPGNEPISFPTGRYSATEPGELSFWVSYGTENTYKTPTTITAINFEIPERVEDPQPDSNNFSRKVLALKFTGTNCGYCPYMTNLVYNLTHDETFGEYYDNILVQADCHSYNPTDPAYLVSPRLEQGFPLSGYPTMVIDMMYSFSNYNNFDLLKSTIDNSYGDGVADAAISVNSKVVGSQVVAHVAVKVSETNQYRVGAFLMENGISGRQTNNLKPNEVIEEIDYNTHNHAIRVADCQTSRNDFSFRGLELGTLTAGSVADKVFTIKIDDSWVRENCYLVFFVTAKTGSSFPVVNVIETESLEAELPFAYNN